MLPAALEIEGLFRLGFGGFRVWECLSEGVYGLGFGVWGFGFGVRSLGSLTLDPVEATSRFGIQEQKTCCVIPAGNRLTEADTVCSQVSILSNTKPKRLGQKPSNTTLIGGGVFFPNVGSGCFFS